MLAAQAPVAGFELTYMGAPPLSAPGTFGLQLQDTSINSPTAWKWYLEDDNTSTFVDSAFVQNAYFEDTYTPGLYNVWLIATNGSGSDTAITTYTLDCSQFIPPLSYSIDLVPVTPPTYDIVGRYVDNPDSFDIEVDLVQISSSDSARFVFTTTGTHTICMTFAGGTCADPPVVLCDTVTIPCITAPNAGFSHASAGTTVNFSDQSAGDSLNTWTWDFGDGNGSNQQNPTHVYATAGFYTVCLVTANPCGSDTSCQTILAGCPLPSVSFNVSGSALVRNFTNTTMPIGAATYLWTFGDGNSSTQTNPSHSYAASGTYQVCLIVTDSCGSDSSCQMVNINCPPPTSSWTTSINNLAVTFNNTSTFGGGAGWIWHFGDGNASIQLNPTHIYTNPGTYNVCFVVNDSCGSDSVCMPLTLVCPTPTAGFAATPSGLTVAFTDQSTGTGINTYVWDFGDMSTSTQQNPTHTYAQAGTYNVCLAIADSCGSDFICQQVQVGCAPPNVAWGWAATGLTATFQDQSQVNGNATYNWIFGDGNSSTQQNPSHTYAIASAYTVCLEVTDSCGTDSTCGQVVVTAVGLEDGSGNRSMQILPNPNHGVFAIDLYAEANAPATLRLLNAAGQTVYRRAFRADYGLQRLEVAVPDLPTGLYFAELRLGDRRLVQRFMRMQ